MSRHFFTPEEDKYLIANWQEQSILQLAFHFGVKKDAIARRIMLLRKEARENGDRATAYALRHRRLNSETLKICDGYDDVPWWMRQSNRSQYLGLNMYQRG